MRLPYHEVDQHRQARELRRCDGWWEVDVVPRVGLEILGARSIKPVGKAFLAVDVTAFRQPVMT